MITVQFFASLRDIYGEPIELEYAQGLTLLDVWKKATNTAEIDSHILIAVNQEYASKDVQLNNGDDIAFFPPVTGG